MPIRLAVSCKSPTFALANKEQHIVPYIAEWSSW